jgi:hypothetical protein
MDGSNSEPLAPKSVTLTEPTTLDEKATFWEMMANRYKIFGGSLIILGSVIGFLIQGYLDRQVRLEDLSWRKQVDQRDQDRLTLATKTEERQSRKALLELQTRTYSQAIETVTKIAEDSGADSKNIDDFRRLFYGSMPVVEDRRVEFLMILFGRAIAVGAKPYCTGNSMHDTAYLQKVALTLSHCMRLSIGQSWGIDVGGDDYCYFTPIKEISDRCPIQIDEYTKSLFSMIKPNSPPQKTFTNKEP